MFKNLKTLRIKSLMVVIVSVLIMSVLMSTFSFNVSAASEKEISIALSGMKISSSSYAVMSGSTSEMVIDHNANRKMQPGKITQLITAMVVIDGMYNEDELENKVTIDEDLAEYGDTYKVGEEITVGDLMNAVLIGGDEQSAEALVRYSMKERSVFISMMNNKCTELQLMDTGFSNPRGSYSTKQYSTAADCAVIVQAAMRYELIKKAFAEKKTSVTAVSKAGSRQIHFASTNPLINGTSEVYEDGKGGIGGFIGDPVNRFQYAGVAVKDDMQLIVVLMDSSDRKVREEAGMLLDYANTLVTRNVIVDAGKQAGHVMVRGGSRVRVPVYTESKGFAYVPPEGSKELIETDKVIYKDLTAPLEKGAKVGEFRIYVADELTGSVDLVIKENVPKGWPTAMLYISDRTAIVLAVLVGVVLLLLLRILYVKRRRRKMREYMRRSKIREIALRQMEIDEDRKRRNWTYGGGYDYENTAPRTSDIRREALESEMEKTKGR